MDNTEPAEYPRCNDYLFMDNPTIKSHVIGMVLGDACIKESGNLSTSSISKAYVEWKKKILENLTDVTMRVENVRESSFGKKPLYIATTRRHPLYSDLRMRMYHEGKRAVDEHIVKGLSPLGLLIWYLDDGCLDDACGIKMSIHSNRYSFADHLIFQKQLYEKFGLHFKVRQVFKKQRMKRYCMLHLEAKSRLKFLNIIEPHLSEIPLDLRYKIPTKESVELLTQRYSLTSMET